MPSLVENGPVVLGKIFKCHFISQCIFGILLSSPLDKGMTLYLNKPKFPPPKSLITLASTGFRAISELDACYEQMIPFHLK